MAQRNISVCFTIITIILASVDKSGSYHVLMAPYSNGFTSHVMDMIKLGQILKDNNHKVTFILSADLASNVTSKGFPTLTFALPEGGSTQCLPDDIFEREGDVSWTIVKYAGEQNKGYLESFLQDKELHRTLSHMNFDMALVDITSGWGLFLGEIIKAQTILYNPFGYMDFYKPYFGGFPSISVDISANFTAHMSFLERVMNTARFTIFTAFFNLEYIPTVEKYAEKNEVPYSYEIYFKSLHLCHADFSVEYPRPLMPNIINIGGIFHEPSQKLQAQLETFVQGAGDPGIIIVAFGTLLTRMPPKKAEKFARVFSKLPQRIIWKYSTKGVLPQGLSSNTLLLDWIPQNDLLGHSQTKLFITHCGMSSTYESVQQAVPIIAMPLMGDQFRNARKLTSKAQMGLQLDYYNFEEYELLHTIQEVIANRTFKENAQRTQKLLQKQPVSKKDLFLHYVDLVGTGDGIDHLLLPPLWQLYTVQLLCLDVIAFYFLVLVLAVVMLYILSKCSLKVCFKILGWKKSEKYHID